MAELWYPAAIKDEGPAAKRHGYFKPKTGVVFHSAELSWSGMRRVLHQPPHQYAFAWHWSNPKTGPLVQHYATSAIVWHAAGGNTKLIGVENEGYVGEALTDSQVENLIGLSAWLVKVCAWQALSRSGPTKTLWEHNEVPGSNTACPSGRIPWHRIIDGAEEEQMAFLDETITGWDGPILFEVLVGADPLRTEQRNVTRRELIRLRELGLVVEQVPAHDHGDVPLHPHTATTTIS